MSDPETRMAPNAHAPAPAVATLIALTALLALTASATSWVNHWSWLLFAVIGIFTIVGDLTAVETAPLLRVSGSFLGLVVAAAVLVATTADAGAGPIRWRSFKERVEA